MTVFGRAARTPTQRRKFGGRSCPGFVDDRRENADPAAFWPSTGRGRVRTVAATCQDRHFDGGGGLAGRTVEPRRPRRPLAWDPESARPKRPQDLEGEIVGGLFGVDPAAAA